MTAVYILLPDWIGLFLTVDAPGHSDALCSQTVSLLLMIPHSEDTTLESHLQYPWLGVSPRSPFVSSLPVLLTNTFWNQKLYISEVKSSRNFGATPWQQLEKCHKRRKHMKYKADHSGTELASTWFAQNLSCLKASVWLGMFADTVSFSLQSYQSYHVR